MGLFSKKQPVYEATITDQEVAKDFLEVIADPKNRKEVRAAFGLPDDGKEWCAKCRKAHKPPVCK